MHDSLGYITDAGCHQPGQGVPATAPSVGQLLLLCPAHIPEHGLLWLQARAHWEPQALPGSLQSWGGRSGSSPGTISASKQSMRSNTASSHFYFGMLVSFCVPLISQKGQQWHCMNHTVTFTYSKGSAHSHLSLHKNRSHLTGFLAVAWLG